MVRTEKQLSGTVPEARTTNQRAEIHAAIQALTALKVPCRVRIISDSQYLIQTMLGNYRRRTNLDLWERLDDAAAPHAVRWTWVRGHAGGAGNEIAHELAEGAVGTSSEDEFEEGEERGICEPRYYGDDGPYYCGRLLALRNAENKAERCPGGTMLCDSCFAEGASFFKEAYNARARGREWEL